MENKQLLEKLNQLGYPLLETANEFDVNETLAEIVAGNNGRYLEAFPILLANAAKEEGFDCAKVEAHLKNKVIKRKFKQFFILALAVYKLNDLNFNWAKQYSHNLDVVDKEKFKDFIVALNGSNNFKVGDHSFNPERVIKVFQNYFTIEAVEARNLNIKREDLSLEFSLSQIFSPKQKELFKKKLKAEMLTKTEKEYFSRVIKKKVAALANEELHNQAQKIMQL
ncbi:MAG: hypothetical protein HQL26_04950 [Candidatus Omnitrophica bacterium]|nr:hypothetical protein [Candidatus Omnitrophota bacterium]